METFVSRFLQKVQMVTCMHNKKIKSNHEMWNLLLIDLGQNITH